MASRLEKRNRLKVGGMERFGEVGEGMIAMGVVRRTRADVKKSDEEYSTR
jgi:hypothetical protein